MPIDFTPRTPIDRASKAVPVVLYDTTGTPTGNAVTVANGADVAEGATTDAAVVTDTTGTLSGKLRGLVKWAFERMPAALGQTTKAGSLPVTLPSDIGTLVVDTELPAAVAASDALSNPTAPQVLAHMMGTVAGGTTEARARINGNFLQAISLLSANALSDVMSGRALEDTSSGATLGIPGVANMVYDGTGASGWQMGRTPVVFKTIAAVAIIGGIPATIWDPAAGKKVRLMGWVLSTTVAGSLIFKVGGAEIIRTGLQLASVAYPNPPGMGNGLPTLAADANLQLDLSITGNVSGFVFGTEE